MINILYCFDETYNKVALTSIKSLTENINTPITFYIIHRNPESIDSKLIEIRNYQYVHQVFVYKFDNKKISFPNTVNRHVSEATYYRLFIEDYLPKDIDNLLYLDADVVCVNNPKNEIESIFLELNQSEKTCAASTEFTSNNTGINVFTRLSLSNNKYFNAGVLFINYKKWLENNIKDYSLDIIKNSKVDLEFWDQDILNKYYDGNYFEISKNMNYRSISKIESNNFQNIKFYHYVGSVKPWTIKGINDINSKHYQHYYLKIYGKYHLINTWRASSVYYLIKLFFSFKFIYLEKKLLFIKNAIESLFKNITQ
tara:strand:- start:3024 stop:3959 length:936 start_codon:yes stop_codon:yes gene_type:complete